MQVFCVFCGKEVIAYSLLERDKYYSTLSCLKCCGEDDNMPVEGKIIKMNTSTVYSRWIARLSLLAKKNSLSGDFYHPITGELIEDIKTYLSKGGFIK